MIIEIDEKDFREIQDKIGEIRATAIVSKMVKQENCVHRLDLITSWANEIIALLHNGVINDDRKVLPVPCDTTKFIEHYDYWMCEKCEYKWKSSISPLAWNIDAEDNYVSCRGCGLEIVELVPLAREGG